jgi:CBS domain containing-hemolysin-like protein
MGMDSSISGSIRDYIRIPGTMALDEAIVVLTDRQVSMAVVVGSGRFPAGIVTLEDLLEPFMGEIEDEHDATAIPN